MVRPILPRMDKDSGIDVDVTDTLGPAGDLVDDIVNAVLGDLTVDAPVVPTLT